MNNNQITKLDVDLTIESNLGFPEYITENIKLKLNEDLTNIKILDFDEKSFLINLINKSSQVDISKYSIDYDEIDNVSRLFPPHFVGQPQELPYERLKWHKHHVQAYN